MPTVVSLASLGFGAACVVVLSRSGAELVRNGTRSTSQVGKHVLSMAGETLFEASKCSLDLGCIVVGPLRALLEVR
eukprot:763005-Amphidinium_carterae.1